jgi:hypothetical protein
VWKLLGKSVGALLQFPQRGLTLGQFPAFAEILEGLEGLGIACCSGNCSGENCNSVTLSFGSLDAAVPAAALGTEIGRHSEATRSAFTRKLRRIVSYIASLLPTPNVEVAQAIFAMLVGTLQLARAVSDSALSDQLLKAGEDSALLLAKYKS